MPLTPPLSPFTSLTGRGSRPSAWAVDVVRAIGRRYLTPFFRRCCILKLRELDIQSGRSGAFSIGGHDFWPAGIEHQVAAIGFFHLEIAQQCGKQRRAIIRRNDQREIPHPKRLTQLSESYCRGVGATYTPAESFVEGVEWARAPRQSVGMQHGWRSGWSALMTRLLSAACWSLVSMITYPLVIPDSVKRNSQIHNH
jgi:hypothetical protein